MFGRARWERRAAVSTASGLNVLAGLWLMAAPFMLDYPAADPYWNDIASGIIVVAAGSCV